MASRKKAFGGRSSLSPNGEGESTAGTGKSSSHIGAWVKGSRDEGRHIGAAEKEERELLSRHRSITGLPLAGSRKSSGSQVTRDSE